MVKKTSTKTMVIFLVITIFLFIVGYFVFQWKNDPRRLVNIAYNVSRVFPLGDKHNTAIEIVHYFMQKDDVERNYLILLQNNMELRPGGGYIGSFAIVKVKNGEVIDSAVHDTANFDGRIPDKIDPPYPIKEVLNVPSWKLRDSNWLPDFPSNARVVENFYKLGGGKDEFDGVFAVNATILDTILDITGPIKLDGYPDTYKSGDAIITLEYQVERGYVKQGIAKGDRKVVMNDLADEIIARVKDFSLTEKLSIVDDILHIFENKDIQMYFKDERMAQLVDAIGWSGAVDQVWDKDYLMVVDANLASYKTDNVMKRSINYDIDLSGTIPQAILTVHYENTAKKRDWMTYDYQTYLRVYVPEGVWFTSIEGCVLDPQYGTKHGKKYIGCLVHTQLGTQKDVVVHYNLPMNLKNKYPYNLKIQKQSGVHNVPVSVSVKNPSPDLLQKYDFVMDSDIILSEIKQK
ncbi:MAG: hypothetical protein CR972_03515 [Candidatus Moraniibacteriota bacterium]|nr:MAG: hypothetical protein CR972_03515 [Candidatus Moranbacteria bacterium]